MNLKTYQATSMAEALAKVRSDLGRDAVILHTRTFKKGSIFGLGGRRIVEITASDAVNVLHPAQRRSILSHKSAGTPAERAGLVADGGAHPSSEAAAHTTEELQRELALVKSMVEELLQQNVKQQHPSVPEELFNAYLGLINQEVAAELANEIVSKIKTQLTDEQLGDQKIVRQKIAGVIEQMVPVAEAIACGQPGQPRVVAFIGPTGVGKTTTIAKLAANLRLRENKSVGLITIDTYRIAAVDQLRTYAKIINVPLQVVLTPAELKDAIEAMRDKHTILIDTAGRSQKDQIKINELKSFLDAARPHEVHLVLSTTASQANLLAALEQFAPLGINRILFTKLDEAVGIGMMLNVMQNVDAKLSYFTTGQNVPDDIAPGSGRRLAELILDSAQWADTARHGVTNTDKFAARGRGK